jgi:hypothetical protein
VLRVASRTKGEWGLIYSPDTFITVGGVRTSDISDLDGKCPIENSKWLNFDWVGYIPWGLDISGRGG